MQKRAIQLSVIAIPLVLGLFFGFLFGNNYAIHKSPIEEIRANNATSSQTASVMLDFGDGDIRTYTDIPIYESETLFKLIERLFSENGLRFEFEEYEGFGKLITQIGDKKGGDENRYWQYWVNNRYAEVGADVYTVKSGDVIEWKFVSYKGDE
jgi:hypothetical protein